ncbi:MAG TPA: DUF305 domain-containing protein [Longimicrobiales bacterium]
MRLSRLGWASPAIVAVLAATACGGAARGGAETPGAPSPAATDFESLFYARQDSARMRYTEADVRFMTGMIAHHAQALVMAGLVPTRSTNPAIRTLAARIINAQKDEIATMQRWLRDRGQPVPEVHADGTRPMAHGAAHAMHMPGMLTPEQLDALERARGAEFDRLFLTYMIQHHRGAVVMVHDLFATDGAGQDEIAFRLASDVQVDQLTEIARMERMLSSLGGAGSAP